jgi:hypothetical protein
MCDKDKTSWAGNNACNAVLKKWMFRLLSTQREALKLDRHGKYLRERPFIAFIESVQFSVNKKCKTNLLPPYLTYYLSLDLVNTFTFTKGSVNKQKYFCFVNWWASAKRARLSSFRFQATTDNCSFSYTSSPHAVMLILSDVFPDFEPNFCWYIKFALT